MTRSDILDILRGSDLFDAAWYSARHPDVGLSKLDPAEHFLAVGDLLGRNPGPDFDTAFYAATYDIADPGTNPLVDYLTAPHRHYRDRTPGALAARMADLADTTAQTWGALDDGLAVSYCIPLKNRLDDIKGTLQANLAENARFRGRIEFLLVLFDETDDSEAWIRAHCAEALEDGYLRLVRDRDTLDSWHFGKAKNAFRPHLRGQYYSSLDGDNFVTAAETGSLLDLVATYDHGFVFHHFSGNWGDGTSGRVTMPTPVYRAVGYDPKLMPRQFDEVDFMLGALMRFPALPLVCVDPLRNFMTMSNNAQAFWTNERLANRRLFTPCPDHRPPLNPRGEDYQADNRLLNNMNNFNAALSALRRAPGSAHHAEYRQRLELQKHRLLDTLPRERTLDVLFESASARLCPDPLARTDIPLFACVHNEERFLPKFVAHYRALGVTRFFFVDDHSDLPVRDLDLGAGVTVVRPKVGDFKSSKTLWLESLIRLHADDGAWVMVADADEFLQLPEPYADLAALRHDLARRRQDHCPGLMLDMVPANIDRADATRAFDELLDAFCLRREPVDRAYADLAPIRWAFGDHAAISWRVDVRYHAFGTVDSLRKFPFFRVKKGRHLNQGFHAFHPTEGKALPGPEVWCRGPILPIFHYKMARLFSEATRRKMVDVADGYHGRTAENIRKIFDGPATASLEALAGQSAWFRPASEARTKGLFDDG